MDGARRLERKRNPAVEVFDRARPGDDIQRVLGSGVHVRDIAFPRLHVDIVHVRGLRALARPHHQAGIPGDHRHHQVRLVAVKNVDRHGYPVHSPS